MFSEPLYEGPLAPAGETQMLPLRSKKWPMFGKLNESKLILGSGGWVAYLGQKGAKLILDYLSRSMS